MRDRSQGINDMDRPECVVSEIALLSSDLPVGDVIGAVNVEAESMNASKGYSSEQKSRHEWFWYRRHLIVWCARTDAMSADREKVVASQGAQRGAVAFAIYQGRAVADEEAVVRPHQWGVLISDEV